MSLHIFEDGEILAEGLAEWIAGNINLVLKTKERYSFVLSGGNTPKKLYGILASEFKKKVDWDRVDFFWGDERYVPFDHERNNGRMAYETLLTPLGIPEKNIFRMMTDVSPEESASNYEALLRNYCGENSYPFDFVLLGMGGDGHTLSVFPDSPLLGNETDWVKNVLNVKENLQRITLMPSLVKRSRNIVFMVQGADKAATLYEVLYGSYQPAVYPSQLIRETKGVKWFIDKAASGNFISE